MATTTVLLSTGDQLEVEGSIDEVIKELENAARSSSGTLARLTVDHPALRHFTHRHPDQRGRRLGARGRPRRRQGTGLHGPPSCSRILHMGCLSTADT